MTEAEAKTKWCPFAQQAFQYRAGASNGDCMIVASRAEQDEPLGMCLASACMAWVWDKAEQDCALEIGVDLANKAHGDPRPDNLAWYNLRDEAAKQAIASGAAKMLMRGFCGLTRSNP